MGSRRFLPAGSAVPRAGIARLGRDCRRRAFMGKRTRDWRGDAVETLSSSQLTTAGSGTDGLAVLTARPRQLAPIGPLLCPSVSHE